MTKTTTNTPATTSGVGSTSHISSSRLGRNPNQPTTGLRVKSRVKAGFHFVSTQSKASPNHNQTAKGLLIKTRVKAGSLNFAAIKY